MAKAIAKLYELRGIKQGTRTELITDGNKLSEEIGKSPKEVSRLATIGKNLIEQWGDRKSKEFQSENQAVVTAACSDIGLKDKQVRIL